MMKEIRTKYNDIQSLLNVQEKKINKLNTKFEEILFNQNRILEMLEQNNRQKNRQMYLLRAKKRLRIFLYLFSLIFIVYYFNILDFVLNCYYYYYYFLDLFNQILSFSQSAETIQSNIQQLTENHQQLLEKMNTNQQFLERVDTNQQLLKQTFQNSMKVPSSKTSSSFLTPLKLSYFK